MIQHPGEDAPETFNSEQEDEEAQAQAIADDAQNLSPDSPGLSDSEKVKSGLDDDDTEDLVDHMNQMESSGIIDMSAYRGEETMDDLENRYGQAGVADEEFADDDS